MSAEARGFRNLRDRVHLGGPLPEDVVLEVVYLPTFHEALGVRLTLDQLEWWQRESVESVASVSSGAILPRAQRALAYTPPDDDRSWRDGITILVRTQELDVERSNPTSDDPVRELALEVLTVVGQHYPGSEAQRILTELRRYFH